MPNTLGKRFDWLRRALDTRDPELPYQLETDPIRTMLDPTQGGVAVSTWVPYQRTQPQNTAQDFPRPWGTFDESIQRVFYYLSVQHIAGAGAGTVQLDVEVDGLATTTVINLGAQSIAPNTTAGSYSLIGSRNGLWFPPRTRFMLTIPATGAGESYQIRGLYREFAAGYPSHL